MPREVVLLGATSADVFGVLLLGDLTLHPVAISLTGSQTYDAGVDPASLTPGPLFVMFMSEPVPSVDPRTVCAVRLSYISLSIKRTLL